MIKFWRWIAVVPVLVLLFLAALPVSFAHAGEELYENLLGIIRGRGDSALFEQINSTGRQLEWEGARNLQFDGNLRLLKIEDHPGGPEQTELYLVRRLDGRLYMLSIPAVAELERTGTAGCYENLDSLLGDKLTFTLTVIEGVVNGETYRFARLEERPQQVLLDRIFKVCITLMLFFIMVGMGLTLTPKDFQLVFKKPKAMLAGAFIQWGIMPLVAVAAGYLLGTIETYPFLYLGLLLICVSPGGVVSNLMTYYARGDLALSVSLTAFSTVLSLFFTPLLLILYSTTITEVTLPVALIIQTIAVLVIVPLAVGMVVRWRLPDFARRAAPYFSGLGIAALMIIIASGVLANLDKFADTERYGVASYLTVVGVSFTGIILGIIISKLLRIDNYQARAVSMESGLRNSILAMTIALLLQDLVGDFHSSMFAATAVFGIIMYLPGFAGIGLYRWILPLDDQPGVDADTAAVGK